jgi:hypothetical protein
MSNEALPPLPEPARQVVYNEAKGYTWGAYTADQMRAFGTQQFNAGREFERERRAALAQPAETDADLQRRTGEPHVDGWPLYSGLPPAASDTPQDQHPLYVAGWKAGYKHGAWQAQHCAAQPAVAVATVTECEACFTPDACQLRGKCDHYAAEQLRVQKPAASGEPADLDPMHLSRILHEMAGAVSMCWEPRPSGVFESSLAAGYVADAIAEIRSHMPAANGGPFAWFCEWFNADGSPEWDQYHDRTDPMPAADEWEDRAPDRVTTLYAARPAPALVPLTEAQVEALRARVTGAPYLTAVQLIRETETAHGITPAKEAPL